MTTSTPSPSAGGPPAKPRASRTTSGLVAAVIAAASFGLSGAFMKPMLEAGWSPAAAVTVRALIGGIVLAPLAAVVLRGRWAVLWRSRGRVLLMALVGVSGTQLAYYAAIDRIPVSTGILLECTAPILLVLVAWVRSRRLPARSVLVGSGVALGGLVLVVGPSGGARLDAVGLLFGVVAMVGCAIYYVLAAAESGGLPPVALAAAGLLIGGVALGLVGLTGLVPFTVTFTSVPLFGGHVAWWVPLVVVGVVATGLAYTANITASELLGSRLASFAGLLEVVAATLYAWILLGEGLTLPQLVGGVLILAGIAFVRSEGSPTAAGLPPAGPEAPPAADAAAVASHARAVGPLHR